VRALLDGCVPVLSVELLDLDLLHRALVQAVQSDGVSVGVGAGDGEALHAALLAEEVFGLVAAVGVGAHGVVALHQLEVLHGHDEMPVLLLRAQAAVAFQHMEVGRGAHLEAHTPAVAAAAVHHQSALAHLGRFVVSLGVLDDGVKRVVTHHWSCQIVELVAETTL